MSLNSPITLTEELEFFERFKAIGELCARKCFKFYSTSYLLRLFYSSLVLTNGRTLSRGVWGKLEQYKEKCKNTSLGFNHLLLFGRHQCVF